MTCEKCEDFKDINNRTVAWGDAEDLKDHIKELHAEIERLTRQWHSHEEQLQIKDEEIKLKDVEIDKLKAEKNKESQDMFLLEQKYDRILLELAKRDATIEKIKIEAGSLCDIYHCGERIKKILSEGKSD